MTVVDQSTSRSRRFRYDRWRCCHHGTDGVGHVDDEGGAARVAGRVGRRAGDQRVAQAELAARLSGTVRRGLATDCMPRPAMRGRLLIKVPLMLCNKTGWSRVRVGSACEWVAAIGDERMFAMCTGNLALQQDGVMSLATRSPRAACAGGVEEPCWRS